MPTFSDQVHIEKIAEALWRKSPVGNAALMVGAGVSRNARNIANPGTSMPSWADLVINLCEKIYPIGDKSVENKRNQALKKAYSTSGALRLAEEFKALFGRTELNRLLKSYVSDSDYMPSELHENLMKLPWADVFTTNWDTLLERAADDINRRYDIVITKDDIPLARQPRIVKLHGSFPSDYPFIFTEEDFRRYPKDFAFFVNMVQQSMMENMFCLIGFSGDDPNFLHWTGWVRDNLGELAPKIYLVGWLDLGAGERGRLEHMGIIPVDLSSLPQGKNWPQEKKHFYALEWFYWFLKLKRPITPNSFNYWKLTQKDLPPYLELDSALICYSEYQKDMSPDRSCKSSVERLQSMRNLILVWKKARIEYEGWILAPVRVRERFKAFTEDWIPEFERKGNLMPPDECLFGLREMVWRLNVYLAPIPDELFEIIEQIVNDIDPIQGVILKNNQEIRFPQSNLRNIIEAWSELAVVLLRHYRHFGPAELFEPLASRILKTEGTPQYFDEVTYQRAMLSLQNEGYNEVEKQIQNWQLDNSDHIWAIRKAGIMLEIGDLEGAFELLTRTLPCIRRTISGNNDNIRSFSKEGCAMQLLESVEFARRLHNGENAEKKGTNETRNPEWDARWKVLQVNECDIRLEWDKLCAILDQEVPNLHEGKIFYERGFDLGKHFIPKTQYGGGGKLLPAYQSILFSERAGMPSHIESGGPNVVVAAQGLSRAAYWLKREYPEFSIKILMRACKSDHEKVFKEVATRETIALLEKSTAEELVKILMKKIENLSLEIRATNNFMNLLRMEIEWLSRLVLRITEQSTQKKVFELSMILFKNDDVSEHIMFGTPLFNLLRRTITCFTPESRLSLLLTLLNLPAYDECKYSLVDESWLDDFLNFNNEKLIALRDNQSREWSETVFSLATKAKARETRYRSVLRLTYMHLYGILSENEKKEFANVLWAKEFLTESGLPGQTNLSPLIFMYLPEPDIGISERLIRDLYLTKAGAEKMPVKKYLREFGGIINEARVRRRSFELTDEEMGIIKAKVLFWAKEQYVPASSPFSNNQQIALNEIPKLIGVAEILPFLNLSSDEMEQIKSRIESLEDNGVPCYDLYPSLLSKKPTFAAELTRKLKGAIICDDRDFATNAIIAINLWIFLAETGNAQTPPSEIVEEIGQSIYWRHEAVLPRALETASFLFEKFPELANKTIATFTKSGLENMFKEFDLGRAVDSGIINRIDVPLVRRNCLRLAIAMQNAGFSDEISITNWIRAAKDDPLPELRNLAVSL